MENRYQRQIQLSEIGTQGQENISKAKVLVVGAGGLGCPILQYLAAAGVGTLGIMDLDQVDLSNLHRQILFEEKDIGKNKAICAKSKLQKHNSEIKIIDYPFALNETNYQEIVTLYDIIVDGTDSLKSRYLINDACILLNKIMVYGALHKFEGQVSVFNYENGPSYRCLFPNTQSETEVPNCSEIGVLGVLPGVIGLLQATEVLKIITKKEDVLSGKMLCLNLLNHTQFLLRFSKKQRVF
jgi:molybdopterin/thiamine biosynthesis adenylyltransferase